MLDTSCSTTDIAQNWTSVLCHAQFFFYPTKMAELGTLQMSTAASVTSHQSRHI